MVEHHFRLDVYIDKNCTGCDLYQWIHKLLPTDSGGYLPDEPQGVPWPIPWAKETTAAHLIFEDFPLAHGEGNCNFVGGVGESFVTCVCCDDNVCECWNWGVREFAFCCGEKLDHLELGPDQISAKDSLCWCNFGKAGPNKNPRDWCIG